MDSKEEVLVRGCADDIGRRQVLPVQNWRVAEEVGQEDLETDDSGDDILGEGLRTAKFRYLCALKKKEVSNPFAFLLQKEPIEKNRGGSVWTGGPSYLWMRLDDS